MSAKVRCARKLHLPIVRPSWVIESAAQRTLLPLAEKYLSALPSCDENASPQEAATAICPFVRDPLPLLRSAAERGELAKAKPMDATIKVVRIGGRDYALDTPTGEHSRPQESRAPHCDPDVQMRRVTCHVPGRLQAS